MSIFKAKEISKVCFGNPHSFRHDRDDFHEVRQVLKRKEIETINAVNKVLQKNVK